MKGSGWFLGLVLLTGASAQAGDFWREKDHRRWSKNECRQLLENSPWAKRHILGRVVVDAIGLGKVGSVERPEASPQIEYQVRLLSARPVRQALVRLSQLQREYDKMEPEQQQGFDAEANSFLAESFSDTIVVQVLYIANLALDDRELAYYWQTQTAERLRNFVFLIGSQGRRVPLLDYKVAKGGEREFQFVFPREYQEHPLVGPKDKSLLLEFVHPSIRGQPGERVLIEFTVKKMVIDRTVEF